MKKYLEVDEWKIIEKGFDPSNVESSESIFSIGNGKMGQRANFEEHYSGHSLQGNYFAGIFYPDKTRVGWWKIGYPEYFGKMINSVNWIGIDIILGNEILDLAKCTVTEFYRELNMYDGLLARSFTAITKEGKTVKVFTRRFISMADFKTAVIEYSITPINFNDTIYVMSYLDGDVKNRDSNYKEKFWDEAEKCFDKEIAFLRVKTKKLDFHVGCGMKTEFYLNDKKIFKNAEIIKKDKYIGTRYFFNEIKQNETLKITKFLCNITSLDCYPDKMLEEITNNLPMISNKGFNTLFEEHCNSWHKKWEKCDIKIEGDIEAQQGIRFNIFQLNQTYTGEDERLNIGPKGFTGEKYGGGTYWDTEAFCFPFYLCTSNQNVARNLLLYRYKQLPKAIENGQKLGFTDGAALFPMVTVNGEECHNEWEITFEEIHRNGAIAYAIYNYIRHTDDEEYLAKYGLEVLIAISRFWKQRVNFSSVKNKYVILGVTGPNEYENNVNNNWYTNYIARWTLQYTIDVIDLVKSKYIDIYNSLIKKINFDESKEIKVWKNIIDNLYLPIIENTNIFLQQEGYLDKEMLTSKDIPQDQRPINQHWSWDRILRSCFIKQADVIQGIYFFIDQFTFDQVKENFYFYEPKTVHESSLSPSIYSVVASHIGDINKAYELYLRTSRLDLDDYNNEVCEGLHITSMAGTWLSIVEGFARKRIKNGKLSLSPLIVPKWKSYNFKIQYRSQIIEIDVSKENIKIINHSNRPIEIYMFDDLKKINANDTIIHSLTK